MDETLNLFPYRFRTVLLFCAAFWATVVTELHMKKSAFLVAVIAPREYPWGACWYRPPCACSKRRSYAPILTALDCHRNKIRSPQHWGVASSAWCQRHYILPAGQEHSMVSSSSPVVVLPQGIQDEPSENAAWDVAVHELHVKPAAWDTATTMFRAKNRVPGRGASRS